jgi:hypothetical protein
VRQIAPKLSKWMADCDKSNLQWHKPLAKELKALITVAKTAKRFHKYVNEYSDPIDELDGPLDRALSRLDKLSKE